MGTKITDLTALATAPDTLDVIPIVDVSDNTQAPSGTTKHITIADLGFLSSGDNISELVNNSGYITSSDFSNGGEAATANRDLGNTDAFALSFITNGVGRINILSTGEVGFGTSVPSQKVHIVGNTYTTGQGSFGTAINPNSQFVVLGSGKITCIDGTHNNITTNNGSAVIGRANSTSAVEIYGGDFLASGNGASTQNTSVRGTSATTGASNNYGAKFTANLGSSQNVGMSATVGTGSTGSTIRAVQGISLYTGASTSYGGYFSSQGTGTTNVGLLARAVGATTNIAQRWDFSTLDLDYFDAGTAGATESGWVEVEIGGTQMYLRAYATI